MKSGQRASSRAGQDVEAGSHSGTPDPTSPTSSRRAAAPVPSSVDAARPERSIAGALRVAIRADGPITSPGWIRAAAKRVLGLALRRPPETKPGDALAILLVGRLCHCTRCPHRWMVTPRPGELPPWPEMCPRCGARYWWQPAGERRRGRPPNKVGSEVH